MPKVPSTDSIPEDTKSRMEGTEIEILEKNILKTTESEHKNLDNNWEKADTTALLSLIIEDLGDYPKFYSEDTVVLKPSGDESCEETATGEDCNKTTTAPPPPIPPPPPPFPHFWIPLIKERLLKLQ